MKFLPALALFLLLCACGPIPEAQAQPAQPGYYYYQMNPVYYQAQGSHQLITLDSLSRSTWLLANCRNHVLSC